MASHHCEKNCHPRIKGVADINCLASLGADSSEAHSGLRRYVQDYTISGSGGAAAPKLTRRRQKLNATCKSLNIPRPGMQHEICITGYMHDQLMITKAKVATNDVLARPLIPAPLFHNFAPHCWLAVNTQPPPLHRVLPRLGVLQRLCPAPPLSRPQT